MHPFSTIEDIVLQHSTRHMDIIQAHFPHEHTRKAVEAFLKCDKGTIFIYTGFYVAGFAETDGPLGAYFLAKSFEKLGYTPSSSPMHFVRAIFLIFKHATSLLKGYM